MKRAFAMAAHPDDIEFGMVGTMLLLKRAGYELHYMTVGNGSCGTAEEDIETIVRIRRKEAMAAAEQLGAEYHEALVPDIEIFYEKPLLAKIGAVLRLVAPEILLVPSLRDYMEDHTVTARLAVTAAFCRGMRNFPTEPLRDPVSEDVTIYHAQPYGNVDEMGNPVEPDIFVDIGDVIDEKTEILALHKSQKEWLDRSQGLNSYLHTMRDLSREMGNASKAFSFAEGWRRHGRLGFCSPDADPLVTALGDAVLIR